MVIGLRTSFAQKCAQNSRRQRNGGLHETRQCEGSRLIELCSKCCYVEQQDSEKKKKLSFKSLVMPRFLVQHRQLVAGQIFSEVVVGSESSGVKNCASDHHYNAGNIYQHAYFLNLSEGSSRLQDTVSAQRCPP